jgi:methanogenic corrinoid protein MtbC1
MNVEQVIEELSKYPRHLPVKVLLSEVYGGYVDGQFNDEICMDLCPEDAIEADYVRYEGQFVLIESK